MRSTRLAFTLALALGFVAPVRGATYSSPVLQENTAGGYLLCILTNTGTSPLNFTVTLYNTIGGTSTPDQDTCSPLGGTLPSHKTCYVVLNAPDTAWCTVDSSSSKLRAVLVAETPAADHTAAVALTKK